MPRRRWRFTATVQRRRARRARGTRRRARLHPALRWWWSKYGAVEFIEPVGWGEQLQYLFGVSLNVREIKKRLDDFEGTLNAHRIPFNDDSTGNGVVVDPERSVYYYIPDAYLGRNEKLVAASFERFVLMLRRGE
jgi:hypothetical protein